MKNLPVIDRIHWKALEDKKNWPAVAFRRRPLMILDAITGEFAPPNNTLDSLLERYGDDEFRVSQRVFSLPIATDLCQLRSYVEKVQSLPAKELSPLALPLPYVFHDDLGNDFNKCENRFRSKSQIQLQDKCPPPDFFVELSQQTPCEAVRLALGPRSSHCGYHSHGPALNMLVFGRKRWYLYPPDINERILKLIRGANVPNPQIFWHHNFHPLCAKGKGDISNEIFAKADQLAAEGLYEVPQAETRGPLLAEVFRGIEVTQEPGESVFVPDSWGHWILNDDWTLSIIFELSRNNDDRRD